MTKAAVHARLPLVRGEGGADRLDLLQTLVAIVETGSLSAAARTLGLTQPSVSRRLQQLERSLGRRLVNRSTHQLALSEDGERCYQRAKEVLGVWSSLAESFDANDAEPEGLLRVVVPHAFGQQLLIRPLEAYLRRWPKVRVEWLLQDEAPDFIADAVDCAITVGEQRDPLNVAVWLAEIPRIVVCAPSLLKGGRRITEPSSLGVLPWLALTTYYHRELRLIHKGRDDHFRMPLQVRLATDNLYALKEATLRGLGAAILSSWLVTGELEDGSLVRLVPDWEAPALPIHVVYPQARFHPPKLRRFVALLRELVKESLGPTVRTKRDSKIGRTHG